MDKIIIGSESDAINLLEQVVNGEIEIDPNNLDFNNWPKLVLHLEGPKYHQSVTPTVMNGLLDLQREINRAYALTRYNTSNTRSLTKEERKELEIVVEVEDGSSELEIDLQEILLKFVEMAGAKMEPQHILITVLGVAGMYFGGSIIKNYLDNRRQIRESELKSESDKLLISNIKFSSEEETKRAKIIADLATRDYRVQNLENFAHDAHTSIVKSTLSAEEAEIQGVSLDKEVANILVKNARRNVEELRIDGTFKLLKVDARDPDKFKVTVRNCDSNEELDAVVQDDSLSRSYKKILQKAEWSRKPVKLKINAKGLGDEIRSAIIIEVEQVEE